MTETPPPPPAKKSCLRTGCLGLFFGGIGFVMLMGMLHEDKKDGESEGKGPTEAKASEVKKQKPPSAAEEPGSKAAIGKPFSVGDFEYIVDAPRVENPDLTIAKQGVAGFAFGAALQANGVDSSPSKVIAIRYSIKNLGSEEDAVSTTDFEIRDSKGRKFRCSSEATGKFKDNAGDSSPEALLGMENLPPGIPRNEIQAFELPNDSFDGELTLFVPKKGLFSSGGSSLKFTLPKVQPVK